jgi:hypothetical protein
MNGSQPNLHKQQEAKHITLFIVIFKFPFD